MTDEAILAGILDVARLHLGADVLVPDLAGWRRTRVSIASIAPGLAVRFAL